MWPYRHPIEVRRIPDDGPSGWRTSTWVGASREGCGRVASSKPLPGRPAESCRRPDYFVVVQVARLGDPAPALGYVVVTVADPAVAVTVTVAGVAAAPAASSRLPVVTAYRSLSTPTASPERTAPNPRAEVQVVDAVAPPSAMRISVPASLPA